MKSILVLSLVTIFACSAASANPTAETIYSCKKQDPWVPSSYTWAEILKSPSGLFMFQEGIGADTQMLEIYFESLVTQTDENHFHAKTSEYELNIELKNQELSFTIQDSKQSYSVQHFKCR